jgi:predicted oxidoreductase
MAAKKAKAEGVKQFVYLSSMAVYGLEQQMDINMGTVKEATPCKPKSDYGKSKFMAEESLKRLKTDYIDVFLLHRPDALVEPEEVARAFEELKASGKVKAFGVSNQNPYQIQLLQNALDMPLCVNQLQFGIMHSSMIQSGINVNMFNDSAINRDGGVLDYCRLNKITIQAWSPIQYGFFEGCFIDSDKFPELNRVMDEIASRYGVNKNTIAFAWILRHPAKIQPVTGTTNTDRLKDYLKAVDIILTREEWYDIYRAAGNILP